MDRRLKLYGGAVEVKFKDDSHSYYVRDNDDFDPDWKLYPSVTSILHKGVNKADVLVPWGVNCAIEVFNRSIVPGEAYDEVQLRKIVTEMKQSRFDKKNKAADIGTLAHEWISLYLLAKIAKKPFTKELPSNPAVRSCVEASLAWMEKSGFQPTLTEKIIFSRKYKYIGTMDATSSTASVYGRKAIVDWKSSKGLYPEMRFQLAAYLNAVAEETGLDPSEYERYLIKLGKENGDFDEMPLPQSEYPADRDAFLGMIPVYHRLNVLDKQWKANRG